MSGRDLEVSPIGDDDASGAPGDAFETLEFALSQLRAGDRLVVRDGTYRENIDVEAASGRSDAPIEVTAAPGERPIIKGLLWIDDPSWWRIRGLNVTWDDDNDSDDHMVKITGGQRWVLADSELWGARSYAALLVAGEPEAFLLTGLYVHDTRESNDPNQDHLIYFNCGMGGGVLERSILARSPNGRAVKIGPPGRDGDPVGNIIVRYTTMVDNRGPSNVQLSYGASNVRIERNIMDGSGTGNPSVTTHRFDGDSNYVRDNVTWNSADPIEGGVEGLLDGGGNLVLDPRLGPADAPRPFEPAEPTAREYGRWAP